MPQPDAERVFAERAKTTRTKLGLRQQDLADRLGGQGADIDRAAVGKFETGKRGIYLHEAFEIAAALGVPPLSLMAPTEPDAEVTVTSGDAVTARHFRDWVKGDRRLRDEDDALTYFAELPEEDRLLQAANLSHVRYDLEQLAAARLEGNAERATVFVNSLLMHLSDVRDEIEGKA